MAWWNLPGSQTRSALSFVTPEAVPQASAGGAQRVRCGAAPAHIEHQRVPVGNAEGLSRRHQREARNAYDVGQRLHTFSIGIAGSPDLAAARDVAAFLGTQHHEYTFTVDEGIDALYDLIYHIESFEQARPPAQNPKARVHDHCERGLRRAVRPHLPHQVL